MASALRFGYFAAVAVLMAAGGGACSSSSDSSSSDSTVGGIVVPGGGGSSDDTQADETGSDCVAEGLNVPDGHWVGPIELAVDASNIESTGSVISVGNGEIDLVVSDGQITGTVWSLDATSNGRIEKDGAAATVNGELIVQDGTISGTAGAIVLGGTAQVTGTMTVEAGGATVDSPLDGTVPATTNLTIERVSCDEIVASFIPAWAEAADAVRPGETQFGGNYTWTGHPA